MNKLLFKIFAVTSLCLTLIGCGAKKEIPEVNISVWTDPETRELIIEELNEFKELHKDEAIFNFTVSVEGVDTCKSAVLSNPENAADIFAFADDQLDELLNANCLLEITENTDDIYAAIGGQESGASEAITRDGKIFAYPVTAGNGYFLYYNKEYFSESDVTSLDAILDIAAKNNKKFSMDISSGWYLYSFYKGAGFNLTNENGNSVCDWNTNNGKYSGVDVTEAILSMATHEGYVNHNDDGFQEGIASGEIIAGINGPWNSEKVQDAWGENYAATMLPSYTIGSDNLQMYNFMGYKILGISAYTKEPEWSMKVAEYLTNKENQLKRFNQTGECPANLEAIADESVQAAPAISALGKQSQYSSRQSVSDSYWDAAQKFGVTIAAGNSDNKDIQLLLDNLVKETTGK